MPGMTWAERGGRATRRTLLAALQDGDPCPYCAEPMIHPRRCENGPCHYCTLNADHSTPRAHGNTGAPDRLAHSRCDSAHGGHLHGGTDFPPQGQWWKLPGGST